MAEPSPAQAATAALPDLETDARRIAAAALAEDGEADVTTELLDVAGVTVRAVVEYRGSGIVAGLAYAGAVAELCGAAVEWTVGEGSVVRAGTVIGRVAGGAAAVLRAERPMLNLLQRACGIASVTRAFVDAVAETGCRVLHTRKTAPGLRGLDVRAVLAGGGGLHRVDLGSAVLVKDNHWRILAAGGDDLTALVARARARGVPCYVEVESLAQVEHAAAAGADRLLLDNQPPETVRAFGAAARRITPAIEIEASGGITLDNVRAYALAGAHYVSVGMLTHSVRAADLALEVQEVG